MLTIKFCAGMARASQHYHAQQDISIYIILLQNREDWMMLTIKKIFWMGLVGLWVSSVAAQADCPTIVQTALDATDAACEGTGRNQACYGNIDLSAVPQEGIPQFDFDAPGDIIDVAGVRTLELEPLDETIDIWGIALMQLQANLPETLPGQNVTFLLFG